MSSEFLCVYILYIYLLFICVNARLHAGRLWRASGVSREGAEVVSGWHCELGRGMCTAKPAWGLHTGHQVHRLDPPPD